MPLIAPRAPISVPVTTMQAAVISGPRQVEIEEFPLAAPGPDQVRVRLEGCGVCASNVPVWEGREWFEYPRAAGSPGHEGWGVIDAIGSDVDTLAPGDRVALLSQHAFAEFDVADAACAVKLPPELDGRPVPGEPLACAVNVFLRSNIEAGQTVAIVGLGFLGALLIQMCARSGARVIAISRRRSALDAAASWGARHLVLNKDDGDAAGQVRQLTRGRGCDCAIEATGYQRPLDLASDLVRVRGRLVIAGYHQDGLRQVNLQSWNWRGIDVINAHEREEAVYLRGMRAAIETARTGNLNFEPLLTHTYALHDLAEALETVRLRPDGFVKAIVTMGD